jgi:hypothetical protein
MNYSSVTFAELDEIGQIEHVIIMLKAEAQEKLNWINWLFHFSLPVFWVDRSFGQQTLGEFKNWKSLTPTSYVTISPRK